MLVGSYGLSWKNIGDNYGFNAFNQCQCFIDNDRWNISWVQDHRCRYTEFNCSNNILNTELDYCPSDVFLQEISTSQSMMIAEHKPVNISQSESSLSSVNTSQTSINDVRNCGPNALECNGNPPRAFKRLRCLYLLDSTLIYFCSSSQLFAQIPHSTALPDPFLGSSPHLTNKSPNHQFTLNSRSFKRFLLFIKYRLNAFFAYTTLFILVIILGTIILFDILKYGFNTGLTRKKRQRLERKQFAQSRRLSQTPSFRRPSCLNVPDLQTIPEEDENSS